MDRQQEKCPALLALHAFTGCETDVDAFKKFGNEWNPSCVLKDLYVRFVYGLSMDSQIDMVRHSILWWWRWRKWWWLYYDDDCDDDND